MCLPLLLMQIEHEITATGVFQPAPGIEAADAHAAEVQMCRQNASVLLQPPGMPVLLLLLA
jgi:hypothetical protein